MSIKSGQNLKAKKTHSFNSCNMITVNSLYTPSIKGSVTVRYIFVHCRFMSLFAKKFIRLRYIKLHIDKFVMIIRTLS